MINQPIPKSDESHSQFVDRFHKEMATAIVATDDRNAAAFSQWRKHRGSRDALERAARKKYGSKRFLKLDDVAVFSEHTTKDKDGNTVVYDRAALEKIATRCNDRILDTGDFAPIVAGHTPTEEDLAAGAAMPDILAYAGNFRLGMIGNKNPRWAIFQDEYHAPDTVDELKKRPRRSVELWTEDRMEDRFFDPIAALGAETPRLDLGMAYAKRLTASGKCVAKYAARRTKYGMGSVPCGPGAAAVSPKAFGDKKKHAADDVAPTAAPTQPAGGTPMALTPDDAKLIVDGLEELPWVKFVKMLMEKEGYGASGGSGSPSGSPSGFGSSGDSSGHSPSDSSGSPSGHSSNDFGSPSGSPSDSSGGSSGSPSGSPSGSTSGSPSGGPSLGKYGADVDGSPSDNSEVAPEKKKKHAAGSAEGDLVTVAGQTVEGNPVTTTKQTVADPNLMRLARKSDKKSRYRRLEKRLEVLEGENKELRSERTQATRYAKLSDLAQEFEFEIAEELTDTAGLNDEQFERHCKRIATRYQRAQNPPVGARPLYVPAEIPDDNRRTAPDKYTAILGDRVKEKHARNVKNRVHVSFSDLQAEAEKELAAEGIKPGKK